MLMRAVTLPISQLRCWRPKHDERPSNREGELVPNCSFHIMTTAHDHAFDTSLFDRKVGKINVLFVNDSYELQIRWHRLSQWNLAGNLRKERLRAIRSL